MLEGLITFRKEYQGQYWLEVFLLAGVTTPEMEIHRLHNCIEAIQPDKVQINTVTRPPVEWFAKPVPPKQLHTIIKTLGANAEIITDVEHSHEQSDYSACREDVLTLLQRRPCSIEDIAAGLGIHPNETVKYIEELSSTGKIESKIQHQQIYYNATADRTMD